MGLDVAVDDAGGVGGVERIGDLAEQLDRLLAAAAAPRGDPPLQVAALDQAHRDDQLAVLLAGVEDRHHVGVVEAGGEAGLAQEALAEALVVGEVAGDHLQRHRPVERQVRRPVDDPHPAARDQRVDAVPAKGRADCRFCPAAVIPPPGAGPRAIAGGGTRAGGKAPRDVALASLETRRARWRRRGGRRAAAHVADLVEQVQRGAELEVGCGGLLAADDASGYESVDLVQYASAAPAGWRGPAPR